MSHFIEVIVAELSAINLLTNTWEEAKKLQLPQGFALIPITESFLQEIEGGNLIPKTGTYSEFSLLIPSLEDMLKSYSEQTKIAYLETEYFGGTGAQSAILFQNKSVGLGPLQTITTWDDSTNTFKDTPSGKGAINQVLIELGVSNLEGEDEFSAIGLGSFRSIEGILKSIEVAL